MVDAPSFLPAFPPCLQVGIDARGILKVTHMLNLQNPQHESMEVSHPLASLDSQVRVWG